MRLPDGCEANRASEIIRNASLVRALTAVFSDILNAGATMRSFNPKGYDDLCKAFDAIELVFVHNNPAFSEYGIASALAPKIEALKKDPEYDIKASSFLPVACIQRAIKDAETYGGSETEINLLNFALSRFFRIFDDVDGLLAEVDKNQELYKRLSSVIDNA